jgi:putative hydrolase
VLGCSCFRRLLKNKMVKTKLSFARFRDLDWQAINCDLHLHTTQTDGKADLNAIMADAAAKGLDRIAFTEHVRKDTDWFPDFAGRIRAAQAQYPTLEVLVGCEAKALDSSGSLDVSDAIRAECDIVLGSVHRFPDGRGGYLDFGELKAAEFAQIELELALGLLSAAPIDVLAHPGGMYARRFGDFPTYLMQIIMEKSLERGIAVEINSSYLTDLPAFLDLCQAINPYVSIGSDMHRLEKLGHCRDSLLAQGVGRP